jgi:methyl-accepting chemotaxis protein
MSTTRWGLTGRLIVPFALVLIAALTVVGALSIRFLRGGMTESVEARAAILVDTLATALADPLSLNEVDRIQALLDKANKADSSVTYAVVVNTKGEAVGSTDPALKGQVLLRNEFERSMAQASGFARRAVPNASALFEVATPVKLTGLGQVGVVRLGVSTAGVEAMVAKTTWTVAGVGLLALVAGVLIYFMVARRLARPLAESVDRLEELARGDADLTVRLSVTSTDEVGSLAQALNTFLDKQHHIVKEVRQTLRNVRAASQHLSGASSELSSRTQEQAASLEESAASLEEVTATVKQNADSARRASQLAMNARATAEKGGQVVSSAVASMQEITRSSSKIAEIIGVIDEIAFQTNLLALNAAVEAARAGEQGRGFAVVAAEVRNLAQRSAGAAKEISALIKDSGQKVQDGAALVNDSGQTLLDIVTSVKQVADIIEQISAASQEQSSGIDQVNRVVAQMDHVVQENAAKTEELSGTARELESEARQVEALVGRFKLAEESQRSAEPAAQPSRSARLARPSVSEVRARTSRPRPLPVEVGAEAGARGFEEF